MVKYTFNTINLNIVKCNHKYGLFALELYALVLGIETPCIIAVIGVQAGGGDQNLGTTIFRAISFHFLGTDNDKIKIVGGNMGKTFHMWEKYYREYQHFWEISSLCVHGGMGSKVSYC